MIYLDNAATTFPKPPSVISATVRALTEYAGNAGRGDYKTARKINEAVYKTREEAAEMFGANSENVVFTKNCTEALNMAIKGIIRAAYRGMPVHVVTTTLEHNSVLRPLRALKDKGYCSFSLVSPSEDDEKTVEAFKNSIKRNTRLFICTGASNAFGKIMPIKEIGRLAQKRGIYFIADCAQIAGSLDITLSDCNANVLCMPGHKGLFGPTGTGMMITDGLFMETVTEGGTGSVSSFLTQPEFYPDRYESGTLNIPGIAGLYEGMKFSAFNRREEYEKEMALINYVYDALSDDERIELYTEKPLAYKYMPLLSFNVKDKDAGYIGELLSEEEIALRTGFHCAYLSHRHYGTADKGTLRVSLSRMNSEKDVREFLHILKKVLNNS
jgi:cysteine desulfurase family protein